MWLSVVVVVFFLFLLYIFIQREFIQKIPFFHYYLKFCFCLCFMFTFAPYNMRGPSFASIWCRPPPHFLQSIQIYFLLLLIILHLLCVILFVCSLLSAILKLELSKGGGEIVLWEEQKDEIKVQLFNDNNRFTNAADVNDRNN